MCKGERERRVKKEERINKKERGEGERERERERAKEDVKFILSVVRLHG